MAEPEDTYEKNEMQRIVQAAEAFMKDPRTGTNIRDQVFSWMKTLFSDCSHADFLHNREIANILLSVAESAFNIGVICGTPAMVTHLKAGKHATGGVIGGSNRRKRAEIWKEHAKELAVASLAKEPTISQEALAHEIWEQWKLEGFKPGHSSLVKYLSSIKTS